jgi:large subunit ribosomal protein L24
VKTRIKKGDTVMVLSGKDRGREGRVLAVMLEQGRALVEHVNVARKHRRQRSQRDMGGIASIEAPIALCKLSLLSDGAPTRVRMQTNTDGTRQRISTRTGKPI